MAASTTLALLRAVPHWVSIGLAVLSLLGTGYLEYSHNDKELASRMSAIEAHREDDKDKLDHVVTQVDKLVDWAIGKK